MRTSRSKSSIENGNTRISVDLDVSFTTTSSSYGFISRDIDTAVNICTYHYTAYNFMDDLYIYVCISHRSIVQCCERTFNIIFIQKKNE